MLPSSSQNAGSAMSNQPSKRSILESQRAGTVRRIAMLFGIEQLRRPKAALIEELMTSAAVTNVDIVDNLEIPELVLACRRHTLSTNGGAPELRQRLYPKELTSPPNTGARSRRNPRSGGGGPGKSHFIFPSLRQDAFVLHYDSSHATAPHLPHEPIVPLPKRKLSTSVRHLRGVN
jgi:hypothetical protein